ncbi:MAG: GDP-mannose 4,6-dehydratase [Eubacterium sp.]|nr:GDP-mannose 4,6-dehydratase [Eubacterium sp.]
MKKALIIGAAGFVGSYLARELWENHHMEVHVSKLPQEKLRIEYAHVHDLDILHKDEVAGLLYEIRPDYIFHLAAQSSVSIAWKNPGLTVDVNIKGCIHVLDAVRELFYKPRILLVGSGEEYGQIRANEVPVAEDNHLRPGNLYAATKACQNMIGNIYAQAYDMDLLMVRSFNHIGPGQAPAFVVSDFCRQVAQIEAGIQQPVMYVGNLEARRDFTDVRDVVRAYALLIQRGQAGETYNVGSGHAYAIREVLDLILSLSAADIRIETDPNKIRPVDVPVIEADISKLHQAVGWRPFLPLVQTLRETLDDWRARVKG